MIYLFGQSKSNLPIFFEKPKRDCSQKISDLYAQIKIIWFLYTELQKQLNL